MAAAIQLAVSTYASYVGEQVYYGDWLKVSHTVQTKHDKYKLQAARFRSTGECTVSAICFFLWFLFCKQ